MPTHATSNHIELHVHTPRRGSCTCATTRADHTCISLVQPCQRILAALSFPNNPASSPLSAASSIGVFTILDGADSSELAEIIIPQKYQKLEFQRTQTLCALSMHFQQSLARAAITALQLLVTEPEIPSAAYMHIIYIQLCYCSTRTKSLKHQLATQPTQTSLEGVVCR